MGGLIDKVKQYIEILGMVRLFLGLIGPIKEAIEAIEQPGFGAEKKQAIIDLLRVSLETIDKVVPYDIPEDDIVGFADRAIDTIVGFLNIVGRFKKTDSDGNPTVASS